MAQLTLSFLDPERWPEEQWDHWTIEKMMEQQQMLVSLREDAGPKQGFGRYLEEIRLKWTTLSDPQGRNMFETRFTTNVRNTKATQGTIVVRLHGTWFDVPYAIELNGDLIVDSDSGEVITFKTSLDAKKEAERSLRVDYPYYGPADTDL